MITLVEVLMVILMVIAAMLLLPLIIACAISAFILFMVMAVLITAFTGVIYGLSIVVMAISRFVVWIKGLFRREKS
jgi:hypothetical protein